MRFLLRRNDRTTRNPSALCVNLCAIAVKQEEKYPFFNGKNQWQKSISKSMAKSMSKIKINYKT